MLKKAVVSIFSVVLAACSAGAPSDEQVKQALYDYYETSSGGPELRQALAQEVTVKGCTQEASAYRCTTENKALNTSREFLFVHSKAQGKWTLKP